MNDLHFTYKIQDTNTRMTYNGIVRIGTYKVKEDNPDHIMKDFISKMIRSAHLILYDRLYLIVEFEDRNKGKLPFTPRFSNLQFQVDISENLGLPRYFTNSSPFKLLSWEIACSSHSELDSLS